MKLLSFFCNKMTRSSRVGTWTCVCPAIFIPFGLSVSSMQGSGLVYIPLNSVEVEKDEDFDANENMMERLLGVDDVDSVYTNCAGLA
jgi:hypothetical protein